MKRFLFAIALVCPGAGADDLLFMAGCWAGRLGPMTVEEQWTPAVGGQMMGMARTVKAGRVIFSEFLRIRELADGTLVYTPRIGSVEKPVEFRAIRVSETEVVFENATHDFPQRILYRKMADGLFARIEGKDKGKDRGEDFPMRRVSCSGARPQP